MKPIRSRACALVAALSVVALGACGGDDLTGSSRSEPSSTATAEATKAPVAGGSLTFSVYGETAGLDPIISTGSGVTGGIELAAVYDAIMRWNPETSHFETRTAESLTPNADFSEWTLKLKAGIKFGDGTAYDAEAVKFNVTRHQSADNKTNTRGFTANIKDMQVVDPLTLKFVLTEPWGGFPFLLADRTGNIVSPTALKSLGANLNLNPIGAGAGPFEVVSFKPKEALVLKKKASYWGGPVYLDELRFIPSSGAGNTIESIKAGTSQMGLIRDAKATAQAKAAGFPYFENPSYGDVVLANMGVQVTCAGGKPEPACSAQADGAKVKTSAPGKDPKVRQALAAAIDPKAIDQRANDGTGHPSSELFPAPFPWATGVAGPKYDPDTAKRLVSEAKAAGWDGKIRLICASSSAATADAIAAQLRAAGMDVQTKTDVDTQAQVATVLTRHDFDLACWGYSIQGDDGAWPAINSNMFSSSALGRTGYANQQMDAAIKELKAAGTDAAKRAAFTRIATIHNEDQPNVVIGFSTEDVFWDKKVHGVTPNEKTLVFLDKTWMEH